MGFVPDQKGIKYRLHLIQLQAVCHFTEMQNACCGCSLAEFCFWGSPCTHRPGDTSLVPPAAAPASSWMLIPGTPLRS